MKSYTLDEAEDLLIEKNIKTWK